MMSPPFGVAIAGLIDAVGAERPAQGLVLRRCPLHHQANRGRRAPSSSGRVDHDRIYVM